ncbi:uncharacterized protein LOC110103303 [Dendrobium catenatum]|uniref:uncharacterized protein LOC110103303 n=1 Tax=Dendrobium catenatum TaxID=906689 RepID=UPI0010A09959|nr:uncharacterized protein LOC110103303 [Dendrobium catenatum]
MARFKSSATFDWEVAVVYADKDTQVRAIAFNEISQHHASDSPLIVGGDFNYILAQADKKGGRPFSFTAAAKGMSDFMAANRLIDPGFFGPAFTWTNNKTLGVELRVSHLTRIASDHCPILCILVSEKWLVLDTGSEASKLQRKCQRSLKALFFWSKNKFKMLNNLKEELDREICILQSIESSPTGLTEVQAESLRYKVQLLNSTLGRLSTWWRQRAKVKWIEEGDDNTLFFHSMASARRRTNLIDRMRMPDGQMVTEHADVLQVVKGEVTEEEIWNGVRSLGPNRAPGRDGVTTSFFKSFWSIVGKQVTVACLEFFATGCMDPDWKETMVVLIPKNSNPDRLSMYRPISLCQTIYKIVAKVLVNRMQSLLPNLISEEQAAFVPGRSISDHCFLGQEVLNKFKVSRSNPGWMAVKVDMEQAYDKMSWRTLELVLSRMGFPLKFRSWVLSCIRSPRFSIMVNGQLTGAITAECGFRQGCPLSPYLFIVCSELLSLQFHQRFPEMGVQLKAGGPMVSHLLYADDVLCFAGASIPNVKKIMSIMEDYCAWTGQRVNRNKSAIMFSKITSSSTKHRLARLASCRKVKEMDYLGIKLTLRRLKKADFSPLLQKSTALNLAWGVRHLSLAGRVTMVNSVLLPLSVYAVSHMLVPRGVLDEVEKICRGFLWNKDHNKRSLHYASWEALTKPWRLGGFGFHASGRWTGPLRARIAWNFFNKPLSLLNRCLRHKYGDWPWSWGQRHEDSAAWRVICCGANSLANCIRWWVGNGAEIDVINHVWIYDLAIARWPTFCNINVVDGYVVRELFTADGRWDRTKLMQVFGASLVDVICDIKIWSESPADSLELIKCPLGTSISAICYMSLFQEEEDPVYPVLKIGLRPRERIFWWRAYKNLLPTCTWLHRRGLGTDLLCPVGCGLPQDLDHVSANCRQLADVRRCLDGWGFSTPQFFSFGELQEALKSRCVATDFWGRAYCGAVFRCWNNRNAIRHGKVRCTPTAMAANILESLSRVYFSTCLEQRFTLQSSRLVSSSSWGGIGIVIRDDQGQLVVAAGWCITHWDSTQVELMAIQYIEKLLVGWMLEVNGLIIEGDNASVIQYMEKFKEQELWKLRPDAGGGLDWFGSLQNVLFVHVRREFNSAAHFCAQRAIEDSFVWNLDDSVSTCIPQEFLSFLEDDSGVSAPC